MPSTRYRPCRMPSIFSEITAGLRRGCPVSVPGRKQKEENMRSRFLSLACSILFLSLISTVTAVPARCSDSPSGSRASNESVEGTVVSSTPNTLVVRTDDNQFQLFTYDGADARTRPIAQGARVRVVAGAADENGTRPANDVAVLAASSSITAESRGAGQSRDKGFQ